MSDARSAILAAIATTQARRHAGPRADGVAIAAEAAALRGRADATRPDRLGGSLDAVLMRRLTSVAIGATTEQVRDIDDLPGAVGRYLAARGLARRVALQPHAALQALRWTGIETHDTCAVDEAVAVGLALGAIAETGSLVFHSGPDAPTLFGFLPTHHIVAVRADSIWPWLEDYSDSIAGGGQPRNINLITGPSGTTDIEGALVRGAHGPGSLHVVLIGTSTQDTAPHTITSP